MHLNIIRIIENLIFIINGDFLKNITYLFLCSIFIKLQISILFKLKANCVL